MLERQTIRISSTVDIINARMYVREAARRIGMSLTDQFCISLATSSLAEVLGMGMGEALSEIVIECYEKANSDRLGLKVTCSFQADHAINTSSSRFEKIRSMVDELKAQDFTDNRVGVYLIKLHN